MPILVKAILYMIPVHSRGGYVKADERTIWLGSEDKKAVKYTGKVEGSSVISLNQAYSGIFSPVPF